MNSMAVTDTAHKLGLVLELEEMEWYRKDYMKAEWKAFLKERRGLLNAAKENISILKGAYRILRTPNPKTKSQNS